MSATLRQLLLLGAVVGSIGLHGSAALAEEASTADSAWTLLPAAAASAGAAANTEANNALERRGSEVFDQRCAACHGPVPGPIHGPVFMPPMPGTQALQQRYQGALPAELERRTDLVPEYVRTVVREGYLSMPRFRPTEISAEDLDALVAWLTRNRPAPR